MRGLLLAFAPWTGVIALLALLCVLVGLGRLVSPAFQGLALPAVDMDAWWWVLDQGE